MTSPTPKARYPRLGSWLLITAGLLLATSGVTTAVRILSGDSARSFLVLAVIEIVAGLYFLVRGVLGSRSP